MSLPGPVRRRLAPAALVVGLAPGLVALAPPASAAVTPAVTPAVAPAATATPLGPSATSGTRNALFRITSKNADEGGSRVKGTLKFHAWNRVSAVGWVNDLCPGDGEYGIVEVTAHYRGNTRDFQPRADRGGCDSDSARFDIRFRKNRALTWVQVSACTYAPTDDSTLSSASNCRSRNFRNPKVAR